MKTKIEKLIALATKCRDLASEFSVYGEYVKYINGIAVYLGDKDLRYSSVTFTLGNDLDLLHEFKVTISSISGVCVSMPFNEDVENYLDELIMEMTRQYSSWLETADDLINQKRVEWANQKRNQIETLEKEIKRLEGEL
jgi:hypothetical protein